MKNLTIATENIVATDNRLIINDQQFLVSDNVIDAIGELLAKNPEWFKFMGTMNTVSTTAKSNTKTKKTKEYSAPKNADVEFIVEKNVVKFGGFNPRDVYAVIANDAKNTYNVDYDKAIKGFTFKTAAIAKKFADSHKVVTAEERNVIRATWTK